MAKNNTQTVSALAAILNRQDNGKAQYAADKKNEREGLRGMIDSRLDAIGNNPREFAAYLNMQAIVPSYSVNNTLLVMGQRPTASNIKSFNDWKNAGRQVNNGEQGIKIYVPKEYTRQAMIEQRDMYDDVQTTTINERRRGFDVGRVFDVTQTSGAPIPPAFTLSQPQDIDRATETLLSLMPKDVRAVVNNDLDCMAKYDPRTRQIHIRDDMSAGDTFYALASETAHAKIHAAKNTPYYEPSDYAIESAGAAYVLCRRFSIPAPAPDFSNIPAVFDGLDPQSVKDRLTIIQSMSKEMGRELDRALNPHQFQRGREQGRDFRPQQR